MSHGPTPYYTPILNALAERVRLHVTYLGRGDTPQMSNAGWSDFKDDWGEEPAFDYSFHRSVPIRVGRLDFHARFSLGISRTLRRLDPDVILVHSWGPLMIEPLLWARATGRRSVMWTESGATTGLLRDPMTMWVRRRIVNLADAFVSTGSAARCFIEDLGAEASQIVQSCLPSALAESIASVPRFQSGRHTSNGTRFLFVGRLVARKRPVELAEAFIRALPALGEATLTFVGDGPLRVAIAEVAYTTAGRVRLLDRAEGIELATRYLEADVLVVPSVREVWGLVVNEALAAGLYVVATDQVASAVDLLDSRSGIIIPPDDPERLIEALTIADGVGQSESERVARAARVRECTRLAFARDLMRAVELALRRDPTASV